MVSTEDLEQAQDHIRAFRQSAGLPELLEGYEDLIKEYQRLKARYEEVSNDDYHFVAALIDGNKYVFDESYLIRGEEGGIDAAMELKTRLLESLEERELDHCKLVIQVFADLETLSKKLAEKGLCTNEDDSLARFIAGFNQLNALVEFIDSGSAEEELLTPIKMEAKLRFFEQSSQCRHIFVAAHDNSNIAESIYKQYDCWERYTFIEVSGMPLHSSFSDMDIFVEEYPGIFSGLKDHATEDKCDRLTSPCPLARVDNDEPATAAASPSVDDEEPAAAPALHPVDNRSSSKAAGFSFELPRGQPKAQPISGDQPKEQPNGRSQPKGQPIGGSGAALQRGRKLSNASFEEPVPKRAKEEVPVESDSEDILMDLDDDDSDYSL